MGLSNLVWIDLEMSGLNLESDVILEIAALVTNSNLDIIAPGVSYVIHQDDNILKNMSDWCVKYHTRSGLVQAVQESKITVQQAELKILEFLKQYTRTSESPLCGNSVWQDKNFIRKYMPELDRFLHYKIIDTSSIKEVINRWYPESQKSNFIKPDNHRALEDITYSVEELRHYRTYFFLPPLS